MFGDLLPHELDQWVPHGPGDEWHQQKVLLMYFYTVKKGRILNFNEVFKLLVISATICIHVHLELSHSVPQVHGDECLKLELGKVHMY